MTLSVPCKQSTAGTGFAPNQDRQRCLRRASHLAEQVAHRPADPDERSERLLLIQLLLQRGDSFAQSESFGRATHDAPKLFDFERLREVIDRSELHTFNRRSDLLIRRDDDDLDGRSLRRRQSGQTTQHR